MEGSLMEEITDMKDKMDIIETTCKVEKDDICNAFIQDFQQVGAAMKSMEGRLNNEVSDHGVHHHMGTEQREMKEIQEHNQILLEVIKEEHSNAIDFLKEKMISLEREITVTNQYNRRPNLVIDGIPDNVPQWKLESICLEIIHKLGFQEVGAYEVVGCHRLRKRDNDVTTPTIIRFINRKIPEFCKKNRWRLKKIRYNNWNLSMREDLCEANDAILTECEKLKDEGYLSKVYTYNGFVKAAKERTDRPRKLTHMVDVHTMFD